MPDTRACQEDFQLKTKYKLVSTLALRAGKTPGMRGGGSGTAVGAGNHLSLWKAMW